MRYRLGLDLGANSLGWIAYELDAAGRPFRIIDAGARIFGSGDKGAGRDAKSGASLAVERRAARAMSRRRDRFKRRQANLLAGLIRAGLFPADEAERKALEARDPYELRARALEETLPLHEIGRALFHLNQRRGFKSNRKADRQDKEDGKIRIGVGRLYEEMKKVGAGTLGAFLHARRAGAEDANAIPSVRARLRPDAGEGYDFYPERAMLEQEFERIWERQAPHHPDVLTEEVRGRLWETVFHQRPLKEPKIGLCTLVDGEQRLPKAHPLFQRRRLLEEVNALRIVRPGEAAAALTLDERNALLAKLAGRKSVLFKSLRGTLKLDPDARFNKESDNRADLKGDEVAAELSDKKRFGKGWGDLSADEQWDIVARIRAQQGETETAALTAWLAQTYGLPPERALATADAHLPEGFGRFGATATRKLIDALKAEVIVYSDAVEKAGLGHHSDFRTGEILDELPYYGAVLERHIMPGTGEPSDPEEMRIGRLTNPTVHIGLNQLRRTVNVLIRRFGRPDEIVLELARELKLDEERKRERNIENRRNREAAERRSKSLAANGIVDKGANRALLKLWEELNPDNVLDRRCIYTGTQISMAMLFSDQVEVDHILPFGATLDDSGANRILCTREANRRKRKRAPFDAFGHTAQWEEIAARAARLPREKRWRFQPDAMDRFKDEEGFLARHLVDTQHLSGLAREYLAALYPGSGEGSSHVWVLPGRLTEMLRRNWGLNSLLPDHNLAGSPEQPKNRKDHRHHAVDAAVIGVIDRAMLQQFAREAGQSGETAANRIAAELSPPWEGFREDLQAVLRAVTVSHRPDHGTATKAGQAAGRDATAGRLHNDTAYGLTGEKDARGNDLVVSRKALERLTPEDLDPEVRNAGVRDAALRRELWTYTFPERQIADKKARETAFRAALARFSAEGIRSATSGAPLYKGMRRVRMIEPLAVIPIRDRNGVAYKGYKGDSNYRCDVWELKDGKWVAEVVSMFDAHQPGWSSRVRAGNPTARKVLSLHQGDLVALERGGERELARVVKFTEGKITLAPPQEGGKLKERDADRNDPFKYIAGAASTLKNWRTRQVRVDELGRVLDPGFPARKAVRRTRPAAPAAPPAASPAAPVAAQ